MTVLADHSSPFKAMTLPRRGPLQWQASGLHILLCEPGLEKSLNDFVSTAGNRKTVYLGGVHADAVGDRLAEIAPGFHFLALGSEPYLQRLHAITWNVGVKPDQLEFQRHGSDCRDVLCMGCRRICKNVALRIHKCSCGANLLVRDHFSARRGLYQGAPLASDDPIVVQYRTMSL